MRNTCVASALPSVFLLVILGCTQGSPAETATRFAALEAAGDATGQRGLLTDVDGLVADSASRDVGLLTTEPALAAAVDSVRTATRKGDSARVAVFLSLPNLEGLPDSLRRQKENDLEFLRSRPRRTFVDTVVTVRESGRWRVSIDAAFRAGVSPLWRVGAGSDSTLAVKTVALAAVEAYYRSHNRPVPERLTDLLKETRQAAAYVDSLVVSAKAGVNPLFLSIPSMGTRVIEGTIRNIGSQPIYLTRLRATLETGARETIYVFDVLPGQVERINQDATFTGELQSLDVVEIQFKRR